MSPSIIHPANENSNTESSQNEARELLFADLPPELQKNLKKSEAAGVHVRAWVVKGLRGQCAAALVLSQYLFWAVRSPEGPGGPFWISIAQIKKQIGLGRAAYEKAHGKLKKLGFCDESFDLYNKRTVRLKWQRILALFEATQQSPPFAGITPKGFAGITPKAPLPVIPPKLEIPLRDSEENLSRATAFDERNVASLPEGKEAEATPAPSGDTTTSEGQNERKVGNKKKVVSLQPNREAHSSVSTPKENLPPRHTDSFAPAYRQERPLRLRAGGHPRRATAPPRR